MPLARQSARRLLRLSIGLLLNGVEANEWDLVGSVCQSEHAIEGWWFDHFHVLEFATDVAEYPAVRRQVEIKIHVIVFDVEASYLPTGS